MKNVGIWLGRLVAVVALLCLSAHAAAVPAAPSGLVARGASSSQVDLAWNDLTSTQTNLVVSRATIAGGPYADIAMLPANAVSFSDTARPPTTTYYYVVRAVNVSGPSPNSNEATATTLVSGGTQYYVDAGPSGDDTHDGKSVIAPFKTIQKAASVANPGDMVNIRTGTYRETVTPARSGTTTAPITFRAYVSGGVAESVTVSGVDLVTPGANGIGNWQSYSGNIYKIQLTSAWAPTLGRNQVFVNGQLLVEARWPNVTDPFAFSRATSAAADSGSINLNDIDTNGKYACTYTDAALSAFPANFWTNATLLFSSGKDWVRANAKVTSFATNTLSFRYKASSSAYPGNGDPYFLFGKLGGLDAEGECFYDQSGSEGGTPYTLYVWRWGGGSPASSTVEMSKGGSRASAFNLSSRSYITLQNLRLLGASLATSSGTSGNNFDGLTFDHAALSIDYSGQAVSLAGANERVANCLLLDNAAQGIVLAATATGAVVENNVVHDCWDACINAGSAQNCLVRRNTAFNSGGATIVTTLKHSSLLNNHVYNTGTFTTDLAGINSIYGGDLQGTEIGYNWVHDAFAVLDYSNGHVWNGAAGIRFDGGAGTAGSSDAIIHHNIVWNTTQDQNIIVWALDNTMVNYGNQQVRIYNNTCAQSIGITETSGNTTAPSAGGIDVRNNIAGNLTIGNTPATTGMINTNNLYSQATLTGNRTGDPGFVSPQNRNFTLRASAQTVDAGSLLSPFTDGFSGAAPDLGALERGVVPFVAGAVITDKDLPQLTVTYRQTPTGVPQCVVSNLPVGRSLPLTFRLKIGSAPACTNFFQSYDFTLHQATAVFTVDTTGLSGVQPVSFSRDGVSFGSPVTTIQVSPLGAASLDTMAGNTAGGGTFTLTGSGFFGASYLTSVNLTNAQPGDLTSNALLLTFDTASLITAGKLRADGGDLRFLSYDGLVQYSYWLESGLNTPQTLVWLKAPASAPSGFSGDDQSAIYLSYGDPTLTSQSSLGAIFPDLTNSCVKLWLKANSLTLTNGAPVGTWTDSSGAGNAATQASSSYRPLLQTNLINGQPAVHFDGANDYLDIGNGLGTSGQFEFFVVYNNPNPGSVPYQRLYSAIPDTGTYDYVAPAFAFFLPYTGSGVVTASSGPIATTQTTSTGANASNLRLGAQSKTAAAWFKGDLGEVLACVPPPDSRTAAGIMDYLKRKYRLIATGSGVPDFLHTFNPMGITIGGVQATNVHILSPTQVTFTLPPSATVSGPTPATLVVTAPGGASVTLGAPFYFYTAAVDGWRITQFLNYPGGPTGAAAQDTADPDHDGLCNLVEYALGLNPLVANVASVQTVSLQPTGAVSYLTLTISRAANPSDVILDVQVSSNLTSWVSGSAATTVLLDTPSLLQVRDNTPTQSASQRFMRFRVTRVND